MQYIKKFFNLKIVNLILILLVLLSSFFSNNPRSSFLYGNIFDHNVMFYSFVFIIIYAINTIWFNKVEKIKYILFFIVPVLSTLTITLLLYFDFFKQILNWTYFSSISLFSIFASLILFFKYKNIWKKFISIIVLAISIILLSGGELAVFMPKSIHTGIADKFMNVYKVSFNDVRPNMSTSWQLAKQSFLENKMLGTGPNQFASVWMKYRPISSINDYYYNSNIENASSNFFKLLIELGLVAIIIVMIAVYKVYLLFIQAKTLKGKVAKNNLIHILYIISGTLMIIFVTNDILFLAYYIILLYLPHDKNIDTSKSYVKYIIYVLIIALIVLGVLKLFSYKIIDKAIIDYDKNKDTKSLLIKVNFANKLYANNFANSLKSKIYLQEAIDLYMQTTEEQKDQKSIQNFKFLIDRSLKEADLSIYKNQSNPYVYINRANIYQAASVLSGDYYELATNDYNKAIALDPHNLDHMLGLSKLEYAKGLKDETGVLIDKILAIKPNHLPAYLTLADMMEQEKSRDKKAYVLQEALRSNPDNQNIAYMLGIEYFKLGLYEDYILIMKDIIKLNPNSEQLKKELEEAEKFISNQQLVSKKIIK